MNTSTRPMERTEPTATKQIRVLVVEDDTEMRYAIREFLTMTGMQVDSVSNGKDAIQVLDRNAYHAVVCDFRLPGATGLDVVRAVHTSSLLGSYGSGPKVILITAYPDWKVLQEAREAGAYCLLRKPLDLLQLGDLVRRAAGELRV